MSLALPTSAGVFAIAAPTARAASRCFSLMSQTVTAKPFLMRCLSMESPMRPAPTMPTRSFFSFFSFVSFWPSAMMIIPCSRNRARPHRPRHSLPRHRAQAPRGRVFADRHSRRRRALQQETLASAQIVTAQRQRFLLVLRSQPVRSGCGCRFAAGNALRRESRAVVAAHHRRILQQFVGSAEPSPPRNSPAPPESATRSNAAIRQGG